MERKLIFQIALMTAAHSLILAHNHPEEAKNGAHFALFHPMVSSHQETISLKNIIHREGYKEPGEYAKSVNGQHA